MARALPLPGIKPALLKWARETAHLSLEEVAGRLNRDVKEIEAWEVEGKEGPSYAQLERLAYELYKRPLAIFFLPAAPAEARPEAEFRALPDADLRHLKRDTVLLIRRARAYQASLIEVFNGASPAPRPIWKAVKLDPSKAASPQAAAVREHLEVPPPGSNAWGGVDGDGALKIWRRAVEDSGVFVFKDTFKQKEISGFCLEHTELPLMLINNSTAKTRQIFSVIHELAHVILGRRAISTFSDEPIQRLPPAERRIEWFCNQIAASVLVPPEDFASQIAGLPKDIEDMPVARFAILADRYRVSREVILRRFWDAGRVSQEFYDRCKTEWDNQRSQKRGTGGDFYNTKGSYLSERLVGEVFSRYGRRQLNLDEAAELIGVKPNQVEQLESRYLRGLAA